MQPIYNITIMIDSINSPYIHAATGENFKALVLENSFKGPVLVNFWSKKAGPCLRQYPILDQLIHFYDGRVLLVNIDADAEVVLTKEYGITSIPTLKLFRNENVVETLHGYQSEIDLKKMLEPYVARDSDQTLAEAVQRYTEGEPVEAYEMIANAIVEDPVNHRLPLTMCKLLKHEGRFDEALKLIGSLPGDIRNNKEIAQFHDLLSFYAQADMKGDVDALIKHVESNPDDLQAKRQLCIQYVVQQAYESALQQLVDIMMIDPGYGDNYAQQAMLKIFSILGSGHPLIAQYRANLNRYIH